MSQTWPDWAADGATPGAMAGLLRAVAAEFTGHPSEQLPDAQPRRAEPGTGADLVSPLPLRLVPSRSTRLRRAEPAAGVAAELAEVLRPTPGIADAWPARAGLLAVRLTTPVRASLVYGVGDGWGYLAGRSRAAASHASSSAQEGGGTGLEAHSWPRTHLDSAGSLATAVRWARRDTVQRVAAYLGQPTAEPPDLRVDTWRDPWLDVPSGRGDTARLLATIGEASTRFALCRGPSERPVPGAHTGPELPALPTAEWAGAWGRQTFANPAFAVRYAHAHAWTTAHRWGRDAGYRPLSRPEEWSATPVMEVLGSVSVAPLFGLLFDGPGTVAAAHRRARPHTLVRYLEALCDAYHEWRDHCSVIPVAEGTDRLATAARLTLCAAVAGVLATGVFLLGVSAPTRL